MLSEKQKTKNKKQKTKNKKQEQPVINLIQHFRNADPSESLFQFLAQPATKICVSDVGAQAIKPHANGPVYTIPIGTQIPRLKKRNLTTFLFLQIKNKELVEELSLWAEGLRLTEQIHSQPTEKWQIWEMMVSSRITLCLPNKSGGFYIPSLEAMKLSDWAIVPWFEVNNTYVGRCQYKNLSFLRETKSRKFLPDQRAATFFSCHE